MNFLLVALGGAVGSVLRYAAGFIRVDTDFPLITLLINLLGSFVIGLVAGFAQRYSMPEGLVLFLKVGVCGGFTTFSAFSLETVSLFQNGKYLFAALYISLSVVLCALGTVLGLFAAKNLGTR